MSSKNLIPSKQFPFPLYRMDSLGIPDNKKLFKEEDLIIHCKQFLGDFKSPSKIYFLKEMPKGSSGKIQRFKIKSLIYK